METEKDRIVKIMESEGLNASQFANQIGIKGPTLSHILNGRNNPSLDVLKRILETYRTINSDWLILGVGPMHRQIKPSQSLSLFDDLEDNGRISGTYEGKSTIKTASEESGTTGKSTPSAIDAQKNDVIISAPSKTVNKIIVYYDDNTFQEFKPNS